MPKEARDLDYTYDLFLVETGGKQGMELSAYHTAKQKIYMRRRNVENITITNVLGRNKK